MTRVAAVDCGTNSIRLLVADVGDDRTADVERTMEIVRLGQDVDRTGRLAPDALERTFAALDGYAARIRELGAERVRMVATSATRDAENRAEFVEGCTRILGVAPEVVSGVEEAALSFAGATSGLDAGRAAPPYLVVDIGGGSTELIADQGRLATSRPLGCVRLTERHLRSDPPTADERRAAEADIDAELDEVADVFGRGAGHTVIGLAGSVTTVTALALHLPGYDPERIHLARIPAGEVTAVTERLLGMTVAERRALAVMHPGRADVIAGGAMVLDRLLSRWDLPAVVASERDILDGIALSLVR